jgi:hypothetical protein
MKPRFAALSIAAAGLLLAAAWGARQAAAPPVPAISRYVPAGALLYLQAKDFSLLLSDWDESSEKQLWLKSSNYAVFSNSRIFLRLIDAGKEFSTAAGVPANSNLLRQVAGTQSALAIYDIGKLEFLYVTRLPSARAMQSALWQTRSQFETRSAGNVSFFVRRDPQSGREVAFAVAGDYLLLATREELLAGALKLIAGEAAASIETETWWAQAVAAASLEHGNGDLRMVLNLDKIVPSPYFRSYWVQRNISDMKQYSAAVSDLFRDGQEFREERVLLRKATDPGRSPAPDGAATQAGSAEVAGVLRLLPADTGVYQAKALPSAAECLATLETKILNTRSDSRGEEKLAPQVLLTNGETGDKTDLETRIDQSPVAAPTVQSNDGALKNLLGQNPVKAILQLQSTATDSNGVFVHIHSAVVLVGETEWDESSVQSAMATFVQPNVTTSQLGFAWQAKEGYSQFNGLWSLSMAIRGKYLFVSDHAPLLSELLGNAGRRTVSAPAFFAAGFNHRGEENNFENLATMLDSSAGNTGFSHVPNFFSETLGSLSSSLHRLFSEEIVVREAGDQVQQTVRYAWAR